MITPFFLSASSKELRANETAQTSLDCEISGFFDDAGKKNPSTFNYVLKNAALFLRWTTQENSMMQKSSNLAVSAWWCCPNASGIWKCVGRLFNFGLASHQLFLLFQAAINGAADLINQYISQRRLGCLPSHWEEKISSHSDSYPRMYALIIDTHTLRGYR